jgi:cytochrome c oxidase cbb3-type subunit IV
MYKNILQSIDHIAMWPVISFVIFFSFFIGLLFYVMMADKNFINHMKQMPIQDQDNSKSINHL